MQSTILRGPSTAPLTKFSGQLQKGDKTLHEDNFVVKNLHNPILGHPVIEALQLVMQIEPVTTDTPITKDTVMQRFP